MPLRLRTADTADAETTLQNVPSWTNLAGVGLIDRTDLHPRWICPPSERTVDRDPHPVWILMVYTLDIVNFTAY